MRFLLVLLLAITITSCTQNQKAKSYGGTAEIEVPAGVKVLNVTWKEDNFWYLSRPMRADEKPDTLRFTEKSSYGVWEGTYILYEKR